MMCEEWRAKTRKDVQGFEQGRTRMARVKGRSCAKPCEDLVRWSAKTYKGAKTYEDVVWSHGAKTCGGMLAATTAVTAATAANAVKELGAWTVRQAKQH